MPKPLANGPTSSEAANLPMPMGLDAFMSMSRPAFAAMMEINGKLMDNAVKLNAEWAEFLNRRLQEDLETAQRIAACQNPQEAQQTCADYWKKAFAQYQDEFGRLAKMGQTMTQQTASAMQKHAKTMTEVSQIAA